MENIPSTMVLHKHVDGEDTRFSTMAGSFSKNPLGKWFGVIRLGTYKTAYEYIRWEYETVSDLCPDIESDSESSNNDSSDKGIKDQENSYYQEQ